MDARDKNPSEQSPSRASSEGKSYKNSPAKRKRDESVEGHKMTTARCQSLADLCFVPIRIVPNQAVAVSTGGQTATTTVVNLSTSSLSKESGDLPGGSAPNICVFTGSPAASSVQAGQLPTHTSPPKLLSTDRPLICRLPTDTPASCTVPSLVAPLFKVPRAPPPGRLNAPGLHLSSSQANMSTLSGSSGASRAAGHSSHSVTSHQSITRPPPVIMPSSSSPTNRNDSPTLPTQRSLSVPLEGQTPDYLPLLLSSTSTLGHQNISARPPGHLPSTQEEKSVLESDIRKPGDGPLPKAVEGAVGGIDDAGDSSRNASRSGALTRLSSISSTGTDFTESSMSIPIFPSSSNHSQDIPNYTSSHQDVGLSHQTVSCVSAKYREKLIRQYAMESEEAPGESSSSQKSSFESLSPEGSPRAGPSVKMAVKKWECRKPQMVIPLPVIKKKSHTRGNTGRAYAEEVPCQESNSESSPASSTFICHRSESSMSVSSSGEAVITCRQVFPASFSIPPNTESLSARPFQAHSASASNASPEENVSPEQSVSNSADLSFRFPTNVTTQNVTCVSGQNNIVSRSAWEEIVASSHSTNIAKSQTSDASRKTEQLAGTVAGQDMLNTDSDISENTLTKESSARQRNVDLPGTEQPKNILLDPVSNRSQPFNCYLVTAGETPSVASVSEALPSQGTLADLNVNSSAIATSQAVTSATTEGVNPCVPVALPRAVTRISPSFSDAAGQASTSSQVTSADDPNVNSSAIVTSQDVTSATTEAANPRVPVALPRAVTRISPSIPDAAGQASTSSQVTSASPVTSSGNSDTAGNVAGPSNTDSSPPPVDGPTASRDTRENSLIDFCHTDVDRPCDLTLYLNRARRSGRLVDTWFVQGDIAIGAHSMVITSVCSDIFQKLATYPGITLQSDNSSQVNVPTQRVYRMRMPPAVVEAVINYIYTGELKLSLNTVQEILSLAAHIGMVYVEDQCAEYLAHFLETGNVCGILNLAYRTKNEYLKKAAMRVFTNNMEEILAGDTLTQMKPMVLADILSDDQLQFREKRIILNSPQREEIVLHAVLTFLTLEPFLEPMATRLLVQAVRLPLLPKSLNLRERVKSFGSVYQNACVQELVKAQELNIFHPAVTVLPTWRRPRALHAYSFLHRDLYLYASARTDYKPRGYYVSDPQLQIGRIDLWERAEDTNIVIAAMVITYRRDEEEDIRTPATSEMPVLRGTSHRQVHLRPGEVITKVSISADTQYIYKIEFTSNENITYGPFGSKCEYQCIEYAPKAPEVMSNPVRQRARAGLNRTDELKIVKSYLYSLCADHATSDLPHVTNLALKWICFE